MKRLAIIADDLTGACDTSVVFTGCSYTVRVFPFQDTPPDDGDAEVVAAVTSSRSMPPREAAETVRRAADVCRTLGIELYYKKVDSTFRGQVAAEVRELINFLQAPAALVCPACIEQGRSVEDGIIKVDGKTAHLGAAGTDPITPLKYSSIASYFPESQLCSLEQLRGGGLDLLISQAVKTTGVVICDAVTSDDLVIIAEALKQFPKVLPVGSAGLAKAMAGSKGGSISVNSPILALIGSLHPVSRTQAYRLGEPIYLHTEQCIPSVVRKCLDELDRGKNPLVMTTGESAADPSRFLGIAAAAFLKQVRNASILASGGDTALAVMRELGAVSLDILGEAVTGVPVCSIRGGAFDGTRIVTKAGGFGDPDTLKNIMGRVL